MIERNTVQHGPTLPQWRAWWLANELCEDDRAAIRRFLARVVSAMWLAQFATTGD